jgi:hypothetical protein
MDNHARRLWKQGEDLVAMGETASALGAFIDAALAEEQCGNDAGALVAWHAIARRFGVSGHLFERCARVSDRLGLDPDTYLYWVAAAVIYRRDGLPREAHVATTHVMLLREEARTPPREGPCTVPKVAMDVLRDDRHCELVTDLLW